MYLCACSQYTERLGEYKTVHQLPVSTRKESPGSGINLQSFYNEITITGNYLGNISTVMLFELQIKAKRRKLVVFPPIQSYQLHIISVLIINLIYFNSGSRPYTGSCKP